MSVAKSSNSELVCINNGKCGYKTKNGNKYIINQINLHITRGQLIAIKGENAVGKSTLLKAIVNDKSVFREVAWNIIDSSNIGFLDQHYVDMNLDISVLDFILHSRIDWDISQARYHLHDFLFRTNEEIYVKVNMLSGGEKVRLLLAKISAIVPRLIILDEITNNLDLITREHIIKILIAYPGALLIVSHDEDFLDRIGIEDYFLLN